MQPSVDFFRKFLVTFRELLGKFLLGKLMFNDACRKSGKVSLAFSFRLFAIKLALVHNADLFRKQFNLAVIIREPGVGTVKLLVHRAELVLQRCNNDKERFFAKIIQLFVR
jgi:hypothetical protein